MFANIRDIDPNVRESWENRIFVTVDIEWSKDEIIEDVINLVEKKNIPVTWFVTHETKLLGRLRENPLFELGIHPNFNQLLDGESDKGSSSMSVIESIIDVVPEAVSVRSHSLVYGTRIQNLFSKLGLTHDVSLFIPRSTGVRPPDPFCLQGGFTRVSYSNDDYTNCLEENFGDIQDCLLENGASVFGFHPLHIFLNTSKIGLYERGKDSDIELDDLYELRSTESKGNRVMFENLLSLDFD